MPEALCINVSVKGYEAGDRLLTESERLMYEDKAEYYRVSGLERRR